MSYKIEYLAPEDLIPHTGNARKHPQKQIRQIAKSIKAFGFNSPLLINAENRLLAGHGRLEAAKSLGLASVPCLRLDHLTDAEQRAYILADNRTAEGASWDEVLLAEELTLIFQTPDLGFDLEAIGFTIAEVDASIDGLAPEEAEDPAADALPEAAPQRCQPGDIWQLGHHRLICGDALDPEVVARLMQGAMARMVFTDPPYNVPIQGHVGGG
jgi:ParB-like chromosome segregation protein Spo0J